MGVRNEEIMQVRKIVTRNALKRLTGGGVGVVF